MVFEAYDPNTALGGDAIVIDKREWIRHRHDDRASYDDEGIGGHVLRSVCEYAFYQAQRRSNRPPKAGARLPDMLDALRDDGQP